MHRAGSLRFVFAMGKGCHCEQEQNQQARSGHYEQTITGALARCTNWRTSGWPTIDFRLLKALLQLRIFSLRLLQDGNVRVRVLPEGEEILVSGSCFGFISR